MKVLLALFLGAIGSMGVALPAVALARVMPIDGISRLTSSNTTIACKNCSRSFDKEAHNGYCPFCGANNNAAIPSHLRGFRTDSSIPGLSSNSETMLAVEDAKTLIDVQWMGNGYRFTNTDKTRSVEVKVTQIGGWISSTFTLRPGKSEFIPWGSYADFTAKFV